MGSLDAMILHCKEKFPTIHCKKIIKDDVELTCIKLENRFRPATTIPCAEGFHYFIPNSQSKISMKRICDDVNFFLLSSSFYPLALDMKGHFSTSTETR